MKFIYWNDRLKSTLVFFSVISLTVFSLSFFSWDALAISSGEYHSVSQPGMKLELADGDYDYWIETPQRIVDLQTGSYKIRGKYIYFTPTASDIGDLQPSRAEILDNCRIRWGKAGIFRLSGCTVKGKGGTGVEDRGPSRFQNTREGYSSFPRKWTVYRGRDFVISVPVGCKVEEDPQGKAVSLSYNGGEAWIGVAPGGRGFMEEMALSGCHEREMFHKGTSTFYLWPWLQGKVCPGGSKKRDLGPL